VNTNAIHILKHYNYRDQEAKSENQLNGIMCESLNCVEEKPKVDKFIALID